MTSFLGVSCAERGEIGGAQQLDRPSRAREYIHISSLFYYARHAFLPCRLTMHALMPKCLRLRQYTSISVTFNVDGSGLTSQ
jgi:hypothetical protein